MDNYVEIVLIIITLLNFKYMNRHKKATIRKRRNQIKTSTPNTEVGKTKLTSRHPRSENTPQAERAATSQQAATQPPEPKQKRENAHKAQTAQYSTPKHKTNGTTTEASPWNDQ